MNCHPIDLFIPEIKSLLQKKEFTELKKLLAEISALDLAEGFTHLDPEEQVVVSKLLPPSKMLDVFEELDHSQQAFLLQRMEDAAAGPLLKELPPDLTASVFRKLPPRMVKRMSNFIEKSRADAVRGLMEYPGNAVGSIMQTDVITLRPDMSASGALDDLRMRVRTRSAESVGMVYVTDPDGRVIGGVNLTTLVSAPSGIKIREIMTPVALIRIPAAMDKEEAARVFIRYRLDSAPVVDAENRLVGIIKADDIIDIIQKASTEDIQKLAGMESFDEPYFNVPFLKMVKIRATWLCVLFFGEMLTATAMAFFEHEIAKAVVLALFIPLIISSGGNSGSQAATLVVRAMSLREINFGDWWRVMRREFASGLVLGLILGAIGFLRIFLWSQVSPIYGEHYLGLASTVGGALVLVVLWGTLSGSLLPIFLKRIGLDPAVASAPFVATLVDVTGLLIYFSVAVLLLQGTLL